MLKILRAGALVVVGIVLLVLALSAVNKFFSPPELKSTFSSTKLILKQFPAQLAVLKIGLTYVEETEEPNIGGLFKKKAFLALNGVVTLGVDMYGASVEVLPDAIVVTVPDVDIIAIEIKELFDPTGVLKDKERWNRFLTKALNYFRKRALYPPTVLKARATFKAYVSGVVENYIPENKHLEVKFVSPYTAASAKGRQEK